MYELIALALQTDSTRIATLEIGGDFMPQHLGIKKDYHGLSHHGNAPDAIADLITLEKYQITHLGKFLTRLAAAFNDGAGEEARVDLEHQRKLCRLEGPDGETGLMEPLQDGHATDGACADCASAANLKRRFGTDRASGDFKIAVGLAMAAPMRWRVIWRPRLLRASPERETPFA